MKGPRATFLRTEGGYHRYDFACVCGAEGELGVPVGGRGTIGCPEGCGATYVQWDSPVSGHPELQCVVMPVFRRRGPGGRDVAR